MRQKIRKKIIDIPFVHTKLFRKPKLPKILEVPFLREHDFLKTPEPGCFITSITRPFVYSSFMRHFYQPTLEKD